MAAAAAAACCKKGIKITFLICKNSLNIHLFSRPASLWRQRGPSASSSVARGGVGAEGEEGGGAGGQGRAAGGKSGGKVVCRGGGNNLECYKAMAFIVYSKTGSKSGWGAGLPRSRKQYSKTSKMQAHSTDIKHGKNSTLIHAKRNYVKEGGITFWPGALPRVCSGAGAKCCCWPLCCCCRRRRHRRRRWASLVRWRRGRRSRGRAGSAASA